MAKVRCPLCRGATDVFKGEYNNTLQCSTCGEVLRVKVDDGEVVSVRTHHVDLEIPDGLPKDLEKILQECVACYEAGGFAASVVMAGLFVEGLLIESGVPGNRLVDKIENSKERGIVSSLGFHVATASRLLRNIGAHYSAELTKISDSDARLTLEMARKLAVDIMESGALDSEI